MYCYNLMDHAPYKLNLAKGINITHPDSSSRFIKYNKLINSYINKLVCEYKNA